jgi:hypothetical protein
MNSGGFIIDLASQEEMTRQRPRRRLRGLLKTL